MAGAAIVALLCAAAAMGRPEGPVARLDPAGVGHYAQPATSSFARYSRRPGARRQAWMRAHYWRMRAYSPYFDSRTHWYPNAWFYRDAYALYRGVLPSRDRPRPGPPAGARAPGVDPARRPRPPALHPLRLRARHVSAVR